MHKRYVLYSQSNGVFLGTFFGMGFWSKLDPVGQTEAAVFENREQIKEFLELWNKKEANLEIYELETNDPKYATMDEIEKIGLPRWDMKYL